MTGFLRSGVSSAGAIGSHDRFTPGRTARYGRVRLRGSVTSGPRTLLGKGRTGRPPGTPLAIPIPMTSKVSQPAVGGRWRPYSIRDGDRIERSIRAGGPVSCPRCARALETQPDSRLPHRTLLDATAHDLVCDSCRRYLCVIRHTPRSLRLLRMRRLAAAVQSDEPLSRARVPTLEVSAQASPGA